MAKRAVKTAPAEPPKPDERAAKSLAKAETWARRGDASMALKHYMEFDRSEADFIAACSWHPYMRELISKAKR